VAEYVEGNINNKLATHRNKKKKTAQNIEYLFEEG
jgi:hypothetical protein